MPLAIVKTKETKWTLVKPDCEDEIKTVDEWFPDRKVFKDGKNVNQKILDLLSDYMGIRLVSSISEEQATGVSLETLEIYCQLPMFKKAWKDVLSTIKPIWEEDTAVMYFDTKSQEGRATIEPYIMKEIAGYSTGRACRINRKTDSREIHVIRRVINGKTQLYALGRENQFLSVEHIDLFKKKRADARKVVKLMRDLRMLGGHLHYDGQIYKF